MKDRHEPQSSTDIIKCLYITQRKVKEWTSNPSLKTHDVLPVLYAGVFGKDFRFNAKNTPSLWEITRNTDVYLSDMPEDLCVPAVDHQVYRLAGKFCDTVDDIMSNHPTHPTVRSIPGIVHNAALAYYTFVRIHPLTDGNGRTGRLIAKAILCGSGLKDPIYHADKWYNSERSPHLTALELVGKTNNLAHLETYLLESIQNRYNRNTDQKMFQLLGSLHADKLEETMHDTQDRLLSDIWPGFENIDMYGNRPKNNFSHQGTIYHS